MLASVRGFLPCFRALEVSTEAWSVCGRKLADRDLAFATQLHNGPRERPRAASAPATPAARSASAGRSGAIFWRDPRGARMTLLFESSK
jgi:hypothetical protein